MVFDKVEGLLWRANMDFTIFFDNTDVSKHIAKYASEAEKASHDYSAFLNNHTHTTENHTPGDYKNGAVHRKLSRQTKLWNDGNKVKC